MLMSLILFRHTRGKTYIQIGAIIQILIMSISCVLSSSLTFVPGALVYFLLSSLFSRKILRYCESKCWMTRISQAKANSL